MEATNGDESMPDEGEILPDKGVGRINRWIVLHFFAGGWERRRWDLGVSSILLAVRMR